MRPILERENPKMAKKEVDELLNKQWKSLTHELKKPYKKLQKDR
jgi:hypothetical protein